MDLQLAGRHALVCGASAGIGRAAAVELAKLGANLTILARSLDKLQDLDPVLMEHGAGAVHVMEANLDERDALIKTIEAHLELHGPLHILINNSGGPKAGPLLEAREKEFHVAFGRHVLASHRLVKILLPGMVASKYGRIINVISTSVREPIPNLGVSNTIRGAVASWSKTLSRELPAGVTINNILPGFTDTGRLTQLKESIAEKRGVAPEEVEATWLAQVPEGRLAKASELGGVIAFLASPAGAFIRGVSLPVDGGRLRGI